MTSELLFVVGLTGVGKSTALRALSARQRQFTLLPNRRDLTDEIVIPAVQRALGKDPAKVEDRLERFRLTAAYREVHKGGIVHALSHYLSERGAGGTPPLLFDNLRGIDECSAALATFPAARFVVLDAPPFVRLERLVGRQDTFDTVSPPSRSGVETVLDAVEGADLVFGTEDLRRLAVLANRDDAWLNGARIVVAESRNYDARAARAYLEAQLDTPHLLCLDTAQLSPAQVTSAIEGWL